MSDFGCRVARRPVVLFLLLPVRPLHGRRTAAAFFSTSTFPLSLPLSVVSPAAAAAACCLSSLLLPHSTL
jgi:hypothetical protein